MTYLAKSYVYKIIIKETNQFYFGYRKANKLLPSEDFLKHYFSSSKHIRNLIEEQGIDSIQGEIIFESDDYKESYWKEQRLIEEYFGDPLLLNQHYQKTDKGFKMFYPTKDSIRKMVETRKKRGCQTSPEYIKTQQEKHNKRYIVTSPEGETYEIFGLKAHCAKFNLNHSAMSQVGLGNKNHHKGWKCKRL
jgi:hypothetical protein